MTAGFNSGSKLTEADSTEQIQLFMDSLNKVVLGKPQQIKLAAASIFAGGHILIEDLPGMGKTTLAQALSHFLGLQYQRVQFTADMLPSDLIGAAIFNPETRDFEFHKGPIFTQVLLADEINRAMPKTQSALLEVMEENQVSSDGETRVLDKPFFVIATQNPHSQIGANALPESQLDRFLISISLGYPDSQAELAILTGEDKRLQIKNMPTVFKQEEIIEIQEKVAKVHASEGLLRYLLRLIQATRESREFENGLSPRAAIALLRAAKAWAFIEGRSYVIPEDIQALFYPVAGHRLFGSTQRDEQLVATLLASVKVVD